MPDLKTFFVDEIQTLNTRKLHTRFLKEHFNTPTNTMVTFINDFEIPALSFVCEKPGNLELIRCYSQCFLQIIEHMYADVFTQSKFTLMLNQIPLSYSAHYATEKKGIFSHNILIRNKKNQYHIGPLSLCPKDFAIPIMNQFKKTCNVIVPT